jgi:hypothetical protein
MTQPLHSSQLLKPGKHKYRIQSKALAHPHTPWNTRSQWKTQVAISDTATHRPKHARGPKYQYKYTQTHNSTQTQSLVEITTQRFGNWFCFRHQVKKKMGRCLYHLEKFQAEPCAQQWFMWQFEGRGWIWNETVGLLLNLKLKQNCGGFNGKTPDLIANPVN